MSNAARWAFTMSVGWESYALTHSSLWVGATVFASLAPNLLGAPVAGVLADRFDRRHLVFVSLMVTALTTVAIALAITRGALSPLLMVLLTLVFGLAGAVRNVSLNALLPRLVPRDLLLNAISLQGVAQRGTEFIGPAVASPLLVAAGPSSVFWLSAVLFGASALFLLAIPSAGQLAHGAGPGLLQPLREGLQYIRSLPGVRTVVAVVGFHCSLTMAYLGILPQFVSQSLSAGSGTYGLLVTLVGLGAVIGTLSLAPISGERLRGQIYLVTAVLSGLSLSAVGVSGSEIAAGIATVMVGASQAMFMTLSLAYIQSHVEEAVRGRVVSVYFVLAAGLMSLANWLYGVLAASIMPASIMLVLGLLFVLVIAAYLLRSQSFVQICSGRGLQTAPAQPSVQEGV